MSFSGVQSRALFNAVQDASSVGWLASGGLVTHAASSKDLEGRGAIGVRVRHRATLRCVALNVVPDVDSYSGIAPYGNREAHHCVTMLGRCTTMAEIDATLRTPFQAIFGKTASAAAAA